MTRRAEKQPSDAGQDGEIAREKSYSNDETSDAAGKSFIKPGGHVDTEALLAAYERRDGEDDAPVSVEFKLSRDLNKRLDRYLVDRIPFLSRTSLQRLIREQSVHVNGRVPKPSTKLRLGDHIVAILPPPPSKEIPAENIPLNVLFEDDDLIIINKHDGIIVHPARSIVSGTMINALAWHFQHHSDGGLSTVGEESARPGVVHRLDRHTTGVIMFGKSDVAHWRLAKLFERRQVDKRYLAVVHGRMEPSADVIDMPLGKHPTVRERYAVRWEDTAKPSVTVYRVRELYDNYTLVELELKTGRTHQIRVHLSHLGWPIVGDDMYGGKPVTVGDLAGPAGTEDLSPREVVIARQALHASLLGFKHPVTEAPLEFQAPVHGDMALLVKLLRKYQNPRPVNVPGATLDLGRIIPE